MVSFAIPQASLQLHEKIFEDFLNSVGKTCTLYGVPVQNKCPNCTGGQNYNGGPLPFTNGTICPYCNGQDFIQTESTSSIVLLVYCHPKDFINYNKLQINIPDGSIQTRGLISDLPLIQRANTISLNNIIGFENIRFKKLGEFIPFGVRLKTEFSQLWQRV